MRKWINLFEEFSYPIKKYRTHDDEIITISAYDEEYMDHQSEDDDPCLSIMAKIDGELVGHSSYDPNDNFIRGIEVRPEMRRKGIATAIYDYLNDIGLHPKPSPYQEPDGISFWNARHGIKSSRNAKR